MPFGTKATQGGGSIDFDKIYRDAIAPAIQDADLVPIRADEERTGGIIHKPMFERLLLCEYAIADLTTANANVFYELGVRHTARPASTLAIFAASQPIPFDVNFIRALPYELGPSNAFEPEHANALRARLAERLRNLSDAKHPEHPIDSPLFQLLGEWRPPALAREKPDVFREHVRHNEGLKGRMADARAKAEAGEHAGALADLRAVEADVGSLDRGEVGVIVDLMLSYRAIEAWSDAIRLVELMPQPLRRSVLVREQLAFALNRRADDPVHAADRTRATDILSEVEAKQGPSPETCGLLGRIYKDRWTAYRESDPRAARGFLAKAIAAYRRGFEADLRDFYPGINLLTLLDTRGDPASLAERDRMLPVVRYAVERRMATRSPDYWDHATMLELAVLASDRTGAEETLDNAMAAVGERWWPRTTARNLELIAQARTDRGEDIGWVRQIAAALRKQAG